MVEMKIVEADVKEIFKKLNLPDNSETQNFEVWEVTPIRKGTKIFFESC